MSGMTRPATARRQEDALLGRPRQAAFLTVAVVAVTAALDTGTLRALDARVELAGQDPRLVAGSWLRTHGLIPAGGDAR